MRERVKRIWWRVPSAIRKPVVFLFGSLFIIAAALTGWIPGPGGIPLFLIGVAILATEFAWAEKLRNKVFAIIYAAGRWYRRHKTLGTVLLLMAVGGSFTFLYFALRQLY